MSKLATQSKDMQHSKPRVAAASTSKMPKATTEQLNLAKLLHTNADDSVYLKQLQQIQECTACSSEDAINAMSKADNDVLRAIEALLDRHEDIDDWQTTAVKKSKARRQTEQKAKAASVKKQSPSPRSGELSVGDVAVVEDTGSSSRTASKKRSRKSSRIGLQNGHHGDAVSDEPVAVELECGEWKGEAIEIVNSTSDFPINIHEDSELLKLVTTETQGPDDVPESSPSDTSVATSSEPEPSPELRTGVSAAESPEVETEAPELELASSIKSNLFAKFASSPLPPMSHIPNAPVYFAPGSKASTASKPDSVLERETTQTPLSVPCVSKEPANSGTQTGHQPEPSNVDQKVTDGKPRLKDQFTNPVEKSQMPCTFTPVINPVPLIPEIQRDQPYSAGVQNVSVLKDGFAKQYERDLPQTRQQPSSVNTFENATAYDYNILDDLQNINKANMESRPTKTDAFTQSLSSSQTDPLLPSAYHPVQSSKPSTTQSSHLGKPMATMPPNTNHQPMQPIHPAPMPAVLPQLLSQFQMYNGNAAGHMFDMEQFQAYQQRVLYEMQHSQPPPPPQQPPPQAVTMEQNAPNTCADAMTSSKSGMPMHHVTTANVGPGFFLPYTNMVFMNGYPNAYMNQQPSQTSGSQASSSAHGGSPLTQHQSGQQQSYGKSMTGLPNYPGYHHGVRQSNMEDTVGDSFYMNFAKQVGYKPGMGTGPQGIFTSGQQPGNKGDLASLTSKLQQQAAGLSVSQSGVGNGPNQAPVTTSTTQQQAPQAPYQQQPNPYTMYHHQQQQQQQYMALAVAAAQQQQGAQQGVSSGLGGPSGMVGMHNRP